MGVISWNQAVDIGGGRGRLAAEAAASLARVDLDMRSAFGRAADINEAWRSPEDADRNYAAYQAYLRDPKRNPWAPIALPGDKSVHCFGYAVDTDDTSEAQMRIWNEHGWFWTVYRDGKLVERWHLEYFRDRDKHRNDPAYSNAKPFEEDDMFSDKDRELLEEVRDRLRGDKNRPYDMLQSIESISGEARDRLRGPGDRPYDMLQSIEGAALETRLRVRGPLDQPYDMLQGILGQVGGHVTEVKIDDDQAAVIAAAAVGGLAALLQSNQEALLAQLRTLPVETIATLKAAL